MECIRFSLWFFLLCVVCLNIGEEVHSFMKDEEEAASLLDSIVMELLPKKIGYNGELRSRLFNKNFSMVAELRGKRSKPDDIQIKSLVSLKSSLPSKVTRLAQKFGPISLSRNLKYNVNIGVDGLSKTHLALKKEDGSFRRRKYDDATKTSISTAEPVKILGREFSSDMGNDAASKQTDNLKKGISKPNLLTNEVMSVKSEPSTKEIHDGSKSAGVNSKAQLQITPPGETKSVDPTVASTMPVSTNMGTSSLITLGRDDTSKNHHSENTHHDTTMVSTESTSVTKHTNPPSDKSHNNKTETTQMTSKPPHSTSTTLKITTIKHPSGEPTKSPPMNSTLQTKPPLIMTTTHSSVLPTQTPKTVLTSLKPSTTTHSTMTTNRVHTTVHHPTNVITTPKFNSSSTVPPKNSTKKGSFGTTMSPSLILILVPVLISYL